MTDFPIPPILHQTWHTKIFHPEWKSQFNIMYQQNPHITFKIYDDTDCRNFISQHFNKQVLWAFDTLNTGAYKADLFRYCVLYIEGGIYFDIKLVSNDLDYFRKREIFLVRDIQNYSDMINNCAYSDYYSQSYTQIKMIHPGIWQAALASKPKNPIFKELIKYCVNNVINTDRRHATTLECTGPGAVYKVLEKLDQLHLYHNTPCQLFLGKRDSNNTIKDFTFVKDVQTDQVVATEINNYREYSNYGRIKSQNNDLSTLHYASSWMLLALFNFKNIPISNIQVLGNTDAILFCKSQFNGFLSVKIVNEIMSHYTIVCTKNLHDVLRFKITNRDNMELLPLFKSNSYKIGGMFNMTNIGNNTLVWHAFGPDNHNITIFTRDNILNKGAWHIISGHCSLFYKDDQLYSIMQWWPSIEIVKVDLSDIVNTGLFIQPALSLHCNLDSDYTKNICFSQYVPINDDELLFLACRQPSTLTFFNSINQIRMITSHQFIKLNMKNNTVQASISYSLGGSYYEQCCEISKNQDDSIKLIFNVFKNDATFETRQGDINLNDISWITDEIM